MRLLFYIVFFPPSVLFSQPNSDLFRVENDQIIYQKVFEYSIPKDELLSNIYRSRSIEIIRTEDDLISGSFQKIEMPKYARELGYKELTAPIFAMRNYLMGDIDIQVKEGRYRVTISDIKLEKMYDDSSGPFGSEAGFIEPINETALNKKRQMRPTFLKDATKIFDHAFSSEFQFETPHVNLNDDF